MEGKYRNVTPFTFIAEDEEKKMTKYMEKKLYVFCKM